MTLGHYSCGAELISAPQGLLVALLSSDSELAALLAPKVSSILLSRGLQNRISDNVYPQH